MAISINTVAPVLAAQEAGGDAPELVLQPGSVVNAQVLKILSADLVRIAIASLSIDVASEIPLQQGQTLQLAVTQTRDGIRLAVVGQGGDAASPKRYVAEALPNRSVRSHRRNFWSTIASNSDTGVRNLRPPSSARRVSSIARSGLRRAVIISFDEIAKCTRTRSSPSCMNS